MYYVVDILTDVTIDCFDSYDEAVKCCNKHPDSEVKDESGKVLYDFCLPF